MDTLPPPESSPPPASDPAPTGRRGSYAVFLAVSGTMLLGFAALVVDLGVLRLATAEARTAAEAAALAGTSHLDGTEAGVEAALASASAVASLNSVRGQPVLLTGSEIVLGTWNPDARTFTPSADVTAIDAMTVDHAVLHVPTPLAKVAFGIADRGVSGRAVAWRPPAEGAACFLPIAVPSCLADAIVASAPPVASLQLANDSDDTVGWAYPGPSVSAHVTADVLHDLADGSCADGSARVRIGDPVALQNGVVAANLHVVRDLLLSSDEAWDLEDWGPKPARDDANLVGPGRYPDLGVVQGAVPVFDGGASCPAVRFDHEATVTDLVWGAIYDVYGASGSHVGFQVLLDPDHEDGSGANGVARPAARLVE